MPRLFKTLDDVRPVNSNGSDKLGQGTFSKVNLVCHKSNPTKMYAMKEVIIKNEKDRKLVYQEINLHMSLDHPLVIRFEDYIELPDRVYIFLEYAMNGDMFKYISKFKPDTQTLMKFFYQTCVAIEYIHSRNIMHRDLKPENILLDADLNVKLCDFGWSTEYMESVSRETLCGTFEYMAPEIFFRNTQTQKTDIWALGILLHELYHGHAPFRGTHMETVMNAIMKKVVSFKKSLPPDAKDLIMQILVFEPKDRPTINEILNHNLIKDYISNVKSIEKDKENIEKESKIKNQNENSGRKKLLVHSHSFNPTYIDSVEHTSKPKSFIKQSTFIQSHSNTAVALTKFSSPKCNKPKENARRLIYSSSNMLKKTQTEDFSKLTPFNALDTSHIINQLAPKKSIFDKITISREPLTRSMHNPMQNTYSQFRRNSNVNVKIVSQRTISRIDNANGCTLGFSTYFKPDFDNATTNPFDDKERADEKSHEDSSKVEYE